MPAENANPITTAQEQFTKLRRQVRAFERSHTPVDVTVYQNLYGLDAYLTDHTDFWVSNYGYEKGSGVVPVYVHK